MTYLYSDTLSNLNQPPKPGLKENIFFVVVFGWSGWGLVLPRLLGISDKRTTSSLIAPALLVISGLCLLYSIHDSTSFLTRFVLLLSAIIFLAAIDCSRQQFEANAVIHLINAGYLGVGLYFLLMEAYPSNFPELWQVILPSASKAFDMLLLCFLFQNLGSYVLWAWITPLSQNVRIWSISAKNLVNLSFVQTPNQQLTLFAILSILGLASRLWNFSLGNIYYTEGSGVPFYISSFFAQFDRLYVIAWLYGYALGLQPQFKRNRVVRLTWLLIPFEFFYQVFSGSKGRFFNFVILPLASVFILTRQRVAWRSLLLLGVLGTLSWLLLYPILVIYRALLFDAGGSTGSPLSTLNLAFQTFSAYSFAEYLESILTPLNASGITEQVMAMTSIIHYQVSQDGSLLWQRLLLFWVPRFIWADKPVILSSNEIGRLSNRLSQEDLTTSVLTTSPGELYIYYGLLGSGLMVFVGLLIRWMNEAISSFKIPTLFRIAVLVAFLPLVQSFLSGNFESGLTGIMLQLGVLYFVLALAKAVITSR
jgi:hypothetical protein